jgi:sterol desaturase/sphingolipid hydroxylase (fatty acid hydroxylase superfamily)
MRQSAISYFCEFVLCPLLAAGLSAYALSHFTGQALVEWLAMTVVGLALWTFVEYTIHRTVYHHVVTFKKYHEAHHADPRAYVGAPPLFGTSVVFLVSFVPMMALGVPFAFGLSVGMLAGYAIYMAVHHAIHSRTPTAGTYLYRARLHHAVHHYRDENGNFGVTTSFWDRVFGTRIQGWTDASPVTRPGRRCDGQRERQCAQGVLGVMAASNGATPRDESPLGMSRGRP